MNQSFYKMDRSEMSQPPMDMKNPIDFRHSFWSFGNEKEFKLHIRHIAPVLTECDLDWKSQLRCIPEPRYSDAPFPHIKDIKFPNERKLMRSFHKANMESWSEWSFYPNFGLPKTYHTGKRCIIDGISHMRSMRCISENSLESSIGKKRQATDKLSIYTATRARPFLVPEYSPDFHKYRSTSRTTTFGYLDTFKPFIDPKTPPKEPRTTYAEKNKSHEREEDILEVKGLCMWRPAPDINDRTVLQDA